jgi:hypothetical protein
MNLMGEISNRIIKADIFIAIVGFYSFYTQWLDFELNLASEHNKPILSLLPRNQEITPMEITRLGTEILHWNSKEIISAIRSYETS